MTKKGTVVVIGGTGYGAGELIRVLLNHPLVEIVKVCSRINAGEKVTAVHTHLDGLTQLTFSPTPSHTELIALCDANPDTTVVVFLALPSGVSSATAAELTAKPLPPNCKVIDLSGDLRLKDPTIHSATYTDVSFAPELRALFHYSLPDGTSLDNSNCQCVSNPGCLASAAILALRPFIHQRFSLEGTVVIDGKTGTSGAGRELSTTMHHPTRHDDFTAYKVLAHRHEPEILQAITPWSGEILFVPHLLPTSRGIFVTVYGKVNGTPTHKDITEQISLFYQNAPFIRIRTAPPRLVDVIGTNFCDISVVLRGRDLVVMAALDNLGKGMVGTAVQNMNLLCGFPETSGLLNAALGPV